MKQKFLMVAALAVFVLGFGVSVASAADAVAPQQQTWAEMDAKIRPLMDQMYQKRSELASLYNSGTADQAKAEALYSDIAGIQAQLYRIQQEYAGANGGNGGWGCPGFGGGAGCGGYGMGGGYGRGMRGGWGGGMRGGMGGGHCW